MSKKAKVTLHPDYKVGEVDKRLYGCFLEPIGHWVYGGIWKPDHPTADDMGFRKDILEAVREFDMPAVRFPGGNWISGWQWKNSIGPVEERKTQLDLAWRQYEPNTIGHNEYIEWVKRAGSDPIYTINVDSEDLTSAFHLVEYSKHPGGTYWSDLRKEHGYPEPHPITTWCLGNETDGPWQISSWEKDPVGYGIRAHEISKIIKWIDHKAETIVCGSCSPFQKTYPEWDVQVLEQCYESVDYVSLHHYHTALNGDIPGFLNVTVFEEFIDTVIAACDYTQTKLGSPKKMMISFDEYGCSFGEQKELEFGRRGRIDKEMANFEFFPENVASPFKFIDYKNVGTIGRRPPMSQMLSALALASVMMTFLRRADRVKIGVMTGGVRNALAFDGQNVWKNASYYPYYQMNKLGRGVSLLPVVDGPTYSTKAYNLDTRIQYHAYEGVQAIDVAAVHNEESGDVNIFIVNRDIEEDIEITLDVRGFEGYKLAEHIEMYTDDLNAVNTFENPDVIKPAVNPSTKLDSGKVTANTKKLSWNVIRLVK